MVRCFESKISLVLLKENLENGEMVILFLYKQKMYFCKSLNFHIDSLS